jgi:hypothetical protein
MRNASEDVVRGPDWHGAYERRALGEDIAAQCWVSSEPTSPANGTSPDTALSTALSAISWTHAAGRCCGSYRSAGSSSRPTSEQPGTPRTYRLICRRRVKLLPSAARVLTLRSLWKATRRGRSRDGPGRTRCAGIAADSAYVAAVLGRIEGPAVGRSYGGAVVRNSAIRANGRTCDFPLCRRV